jgi:hypothetical protein
MDNIVNGDAVIFKNYDTPQTIKLVIKILGKSAIVIDFDENTNVDENEYIAYYVKLKKLVKVF